MAANPSTHHERDYIERTIATVRNHRDADNCWPQWANIFADEIERLWAALAVAEANATRRDAVSLKPGHAPHGGLSGPAERPAPPATESVEVLDFVEVGHTPKSTEQGWPLTGLCGICGQTVGCECAA